MGQGTAPSMRQRELYDARVQKWWLVLAALALTLSFAKAADAAPRDAQALKLDDDAINNDYLATKFGDAERKLKQGIAICGKSACSPNVAGVESIEEDDNDKTSRNGTEAVGIQLVSTAAPGKFAAFGFSRHRKGETLTFGAIPFADPKLVSSAT